MSTTIHPTALVDPSAELDSDVTIGPFCIVEKGVRIGRATKLLARVHLLGGTTLGERNELHSGVVLGDQPQDKAFDPKTESFLIIGDDNIFRENATAHRASTPGGATRIGNRGFFMGNSHAAHDVVIGDDVVICNNTVLAGYVEIGNRAFISGNVVIHQFTRIGELCMLGGGAAAGQDAPPFTTVIGRSRIRGLNVVGMRRGGISPSTRLEIKKLYKQIFALRGSFDAVQTLLKDIPDIPEIQRIAAFYQSPGRRGFMWPPADTHDRHGDGHQEAF